MWVIVQDWKEKKTLWAHGEGDKDLHDMVQYLIDSILPEYITSFNIFWNDGREISLEEYRKANNIRKRSFEERMELNWYE